MKRLFIAATQQNDGKTTVSLGLICAFKRRFKKIGFIKPVGQRYLIEAGYKVDEDSVLIERVCGIEGALRDMSPVAIERGFTERYILKGKRSDIEREIRRSFERVAKGRDLVIIEGTGHAGVGSVFDWSNADCAKFLRSKVLIVASGGIGRPIDEIMLNIALFEARGVEVIGVIINKVQEEKYDKINRIVRLGLRRKNIELFGCIPYREFLSKPTVNSVLQESGAKLISGSEGLNHRVEKVIVGAMAPHEAVKYIVDCSLLITPGDREDIIMTAVSKHTVRGGVHISGIVLTGGLLPDRSILRLLAKTDIPVLLMKGDTYSIASMIHDLTVKIQPEDCDKIKAVQCLVEKYVDVDAILERI